MTGIVVASVVAAWAGATLLLARVRAVSRPRLDARVAPFLATARPAEPPSTMLDVLAPMAQLAGDALARVVGVSEPLDVRLERVHDGRDARGFRVGQATIALVAAAAATVVVLVSGASAVVAFAIVVAAPVVACLATEHRLTERNRDWQRRLDRELPVVAEQLGMLLASGWSLGAAIARLAERGSGAAAADLRRVVARVAHGLDEARALREWAALARCESVDRLVGVLVLERETADLGRLISEEARAMRRASQRALVALLDKRSQMVWIPVTVAALVPGVIFLAVPFLEVLRIFTDR